MPPFLQIRFTRIDVPEAVHVLPAVLCMHVRNRLHMMTDDRVLSEIVRIDAEILCRRVREWVRLQFVPNVLG